MEQYISLGVFILLVFAAASTGAVFKPGEWYETLDKPGWTPPNWLFPIAWAVLYLLIALAGWYVWKADGLGLAVMVWGVQLVLNAAWSYFMFGARRIDLAMYDVAGMLISIIAFMMLAWPLSQTAVLIS